MKVININDYNDLELALMCIIGYLGYGVDRKNILGTRYSNVQSMVNQVMYGNIPKSPNTKQLDLDKVRKVLIKEIPSEKDYNDYINHLIQLIEKEG